MNALVWAGFLLAATPQAAPDSNAKTADDLRAEIIAEMPGWLQQHDVPSAAVAYIERGCVAWTVVRGRAGPNMPADEQTLYNVASLTKPLAAEAILRLASSGKIDLDEPMYPHWVDPDLADDPRHRKLTPRVALTHRTGFANWRRQTDGQLKFRSEPGTQPGYSGEGYEYVARFAERKLGRDFEALVAATVFEPLGLERTALTKKPWFETSRLAMSHGPKGASRPPDVRLRASAADDAFTRIGDYAAFTAAVMRNEGLRPMIAAQRLRVDVPRFQGRCPWGPVGCPKRIGFGLAWAVFDYGIETVVLQGGADWGERAVALFVPERGIGIVVLTNSARGGRIIHEVVTTLYDNPDFHRFLAFQAK